MQTRSFSRRGGTRRGTAAALVAATLLASAALLSLQAAPASAATCAELTQQLLDNRAESRRLYAELEPISRQITALGLQIEAIQAEMARHPRSAVPAGLYNQYAALLGQRNRIINTDEQRITGQLSRVSLQRDLIEGRFHNANCGQLPKGDGSCIPESFGAGVGTNPEGYEDASPQVRRAADAAARSLISDIASPTPKGVTIQSDRSLQDSVSGDPTANPVAPGGTLRAGTEGGHTPLNPDSSFLMEYHRLNIDGSQLLLVQFQNSSGVALRTPNPGDPGSGSSLESYPDGLWVVPRNTRDPIKPLDTAVSQMGSRARQVMNLAGKILDAAAGRGEANDNRCGFHFEYLFNGGGSVRSSALPPASEDAPPTPTPPTVEPPSTTGGSGTVHYIASTCGAVDGAWSGKIFVGTPDSGRGFSLAFSSNLVRGRASGVSLDSAYAHIFFKDEIDTTNQEGMDAWYSSLKRTKEALAADFGRMSMTLVTPSRPSRTNLGRIRLAHVGSPPLDFAIKRGCGGALAPPHYTAHDTP